jgi:serine/threonine protein kinase
MYEQEMKRHIFQGIVDGEKVVVKFCHAYSEDAHSLVAGIGCAPRLYCCIDVSSRFKMVVMEFVEGEDLGSYLRNETDHAKKQNIVDQCRNVVGTLHDGNLCHGDFRDVNVLVRRNSNTICVLDYDWAGRLDQARYPLYMNHVHIQWPEGATDGALITKEHDLFWLGKFADALHTL